MKVGKFSTSNQKRYASSVGTLTIMLFSTRCMNDFPPLGPGDRVALPTLGGRTRPFKALVRRASGKFRALYSTEASLDSRVGPAHAALHYSLPAWPPHLATRSHAQLF